MGTAPVEAVLSKIREHLESEMQRVRDEIQAYPTPIPACDAQFNHLLEQREALSEELSRVRELMSEGADSGDPLSAIDALLNSSGHLDAATREEIRTLIENENP